jgi:hypothetical protein
LHTASKATQENSKTIAADLRERALEVKKLDEGLRKHELEVNERKQQQQVLKRSQRALKGSVSRIVMIGLKDLQQKPDEAALNSQEPRRKRVPNNGDLEKLPQPFDATNMPLNDSALFPLRFTGVHGAPVSISSEIDFSRSPIRGNSGLVDQI